MLYFVLMQVYLTCIRLIKLTLDERSDSIRPSADASGTVRNERRKLLA